jgi:anti-sigma factor ChrR (cupin superfamily)
MSLMLSCEDVTHLATDHFEGRLSPGLALRMRLHLALCRACRAFLRSLRTLPRFLGSLAAEPAPDLEDPACRQRREAEAGALAGALARIAGGAPPRRPGPAHPAPAEALAAAGAPEADRTLVLMARAYEALRAEGPVAEEPYLPAALRSDLPDPGAWRWSKALLRGCRIAELLRDPRSGARLCLMVLPPGCRFPDHVHRGGEDFLVLHGHVEDAEHYASPGDWLRLHTATEHRNLEGRQEACWGLVRVEREGIRLLGWRGALLRIFGGGA